MTQVQMIFQDPFSSLNPRRTIFQILNEGHEALLGKPLEKEVLHALLDDCRTCARSPLSLPARVLRRPATKDCHCPRFGGASQAFVVR